MHEKYNKMSVENNLFRGLEKLSFEDVMRQGKQKKVLSVLL